MPCAFFPLRRELAVSEDVRETCTIEELAEVADVQVVLVLDGLVAEIDHLLVDEGVVAAEVAEDAGKVGGLHVLGCVDAEALDADADEVVEVLSNGLLHVRRVGVKVGERAQVAVPDPPSIVLVVAGVDLAVALAREVRAVVEVVVLELRVVIIPKAAAPRACLALTLSKHKESSDFSHTHTHTIHQPPIHQHQPHKRWTRDIPPTHTLTHMILIVCGCVGIFFVCICLTSQSEARKVSYISQEA